VPILNTAILPCGEFEQTLKLAFLLYN
jgi:hypothetical protein